MGCKKVTIQIGKAILQAVTPTGVKFITRIVGILAETDWSNSQKRDTAVEMAKAEAKQAGREIKESAIRATVEVAVMGLKTAGDALDQLGEDPDAEGTETI